jgi:hypothetical protein
MSKDGKSGKLIRTDIGTGYRMNKVNWKIYFFISYEKFCW